MSNEAPRVIVNGEAVVFDGPAPATVQEVVGLVDGALAQQGQIIEACQVDGHALSDDPKLLQGRYATVEITARPWSEVCADAVRNACSEVRPAMKDASVFGASMLVVPLSQVVKEIDQLADKLRIIVRPIEVALSYAEGFEAPWKQDVERLSQRVQQACEDFSAALEIQDVGRASDVLCLLLPKYLVEFAHLAESPWRGVDV